MTDKPENEIWKPIPGYEGYYEVSNMGRCKSLDRSMLRTNGKGEYWFTVPGKILAPGALKNRMYKHYTLCKNGKQKSYIAHRLIMLAFHGPSNLGVNHKNGDGADNRLENLEYVSTRENRVHSINRDGFTGVYKFRDNAYQSYIYDSGKRRFLGHFKTPELASAAYKKALEEMGHGTKYIKFAN